MNEYIGKKGIYDGKIIEVSEIAHKSEEYFSVYEIVRIEEGVALFPGAHLDRLSQSLTLESLDINETREELEAMINELIKANEINKGKIKFVFYFPVYPLSKGYHFLIYFTEASFPAPQQYSEGVDVAFCNAVRDDPNAKVLNTKARKTANQKISEENVFEVLLIGNDGYITEGSRSNVFFIFEDYLVTPPDESVLQGIARKNVIEICKENGIPLEIRKVHQSELKQPESVFLTGTSLKVLPVRQIGVFKYNINSDLLIFLMSEYDRRIEEQISNKDK